METTNARRLLPKWLKRPVKKALLRRGLRGAIRKIGKLADGEVPDRQLLAELIDGWSNDGFVANLDYLEAMAKRSVATPGPILECGSGATTILLGLLCARRGVEVWSLEHSAEWRERIEQVLTSNGITGVRVCFAPLIEYGEFVWYDPPLPEMPKQFSLVICDGPPGTTRGSRYGLMPVMGERLPPGATILLDDAGRPAETEMIERWENEAAFETEVFAAQGGRFAVMRLEARPTHWERGRLAR